MQTLIKCLLYAGLAWRCVLIPPPLQRRRLGETCRVGVAPVLVRSGWRQGHYIPGSLSLPQRGPEEESLLRTLSFVGCGVSFCALATTFLLFLAVR